MSFLSFHPRQLSLPLRIEIWLDTAGYIERQAGCFISVRLLFFIITFIIIYICYAKCLSSQP